MEEEPKKGRQLRLDGPGWCVAASHWTSWRAACVEADGGCWRTLRPRTECAPSWSTWDCPGSLRDWPQREGHLRTRGVEAQAESHRLLRPHGEGGRAGVCPRLLHGGRSHVEHP